MPKINLAIIKSEYNKEITDGLLKKCLETLFKRGVKKKDIDIVNVPGAFEIPLAAKKLAKKKKYDALIALGCVIKGDTDHFELVVNECARGVMNVMLEYETPIIYEVLACYNEKDARKRIRKGEEAAYTALEILKTYANIL